MIIARSLVLFGILLSLLDAASAQTWPARPIKLIVPTGPGSGTDVMARLLIEGVSRELGQQMYIENMPGATGMIGARAAARAEPDGYTLYFAPSSSLSSNLFFYKSVPYDPVQDFSPVAMVVDSSPFVVSVHPDLPAKTLPELIALARGQPGKLTYGVDMSSGYQVILGQMLAKRASINLVRVPYKSAPQMLQDAAAGVVPIVLTSLGATIGLARSNKLRMLAIAADRRFPGFDDLPTVSETLPGIRIDGWFVVVGPRGLPASIAQQVNTAIDRVLKRPDVAARLPDMGLTTSGAGTPASTGEFIRAELDRWRALAQEFDIQPQ